MEHDYHVMCLEECPRCKQFESEYKFMNCSFTVERKEEGRVTQSFECSKCKFKCEHLYKC